LVLCELPEDESKTTPYKLRADRRLVGGEWAGLFGWHGFGPAVGAAPQVAAKAKAKAALKALPKAAAAAPKALPRAAPATAKVPWDVFKRRLTWKKMGGAAGPLVAGVKQFTNSRKSMKIWARDIFAGRLRNKYSYGVDRIFFQRVGARPGGGSPMPALAEDVLEMVYATY